MSIKKLGRYELIRVLGKGAMGLVYEGRDPNLDRRVAIKTIKVENLSEEAAAEYEVRFRTEARSAARLQHPNIVSVYDSDRDGDIAFLVMEFIAGDDLKHHLDKGELYSLEQSLTIMTDLLSALDYAHRQSIVHRDIKPANLLIEASGRVKLTDFGVARIQDSGETTRTQGSIVGTLKYMSPEQVQGLPIDARADLFAAGIVLYQLLTGKRPFDGDTDFATIQQIVGHNPAPPSTFNPKLPAAMDGVVARALAKKRDQRYATAQEFSAALEAAAREAADPTVLPPAVEGGPGRQSTWTSTLLAGEALTGLQSGTSGGVSTVTQEVELVYWKDIKESTDLEDIQGFLDKFPSGIYADLARRRLRKLGGGSGEDSDVRQRTGTLVVPRSAVTPSSPAGTADPDGAWSALEQAARAAPAAAGPAASPTSAPHPASDDPDATRLGAPVVRPPAGAAVDVVDASAVVSASDDKAAADNSVATEESSRPATVITADASASEQTPASETSAPSSEEAAASAPPVSTTPRTPASAAPSRRGVWVVAAVALLVVGGTVFKLSSGSGATASAPDAAAVSPDASPASNESPSTPQPAQAAAVAPAASAASAPLSSASAAKAAAVAAARKAAIEKERAAKAAAAKQTAERAPDRPSAPERSSTAAVPAPAAAATATGPRQACEGRVLIGFQICMTEQCAKPEFANRPVCLERRAAEQRRRESEQIRN